MGTNLGNEFRVGLQALFDPDRVKVREERICTLKEWRKLAGECVQEEKQLGQGMPSHVAWVLAPKRARVFSKLLEISGFPDTELGSDIAKGFSLTGMQGRTGIFPPKLRGASVLEGCSQHGDRLELGNDCNT